MEPVRVFLSILAAFRLAQFLAIDEGPFRIFSRLRARLGRNAAAQWNTNGAWHVLAEITHCPFCSGVWFALFLTFPVLFPSIPGDLLLGVLGIAGGQCFLQTVSSRSERQGDRK